MTVKFVEHGEVACIWFDDSKKKHEERFPVASLGKPKPRRTTAVLSPGI